MSTHKDKTPIRKSTSYFHKQIIEALDLCPDPADLKIVIAPSTQAALAVRAAIARLGRALVNIEALTPSGLSLHIWKSLFPADTNRLVSRGKLELVMGAHLLNLPWEEAGIFSGSVPSTVRAIIADRQAGRDASWANATATTVSQRVFASLFETYESYLLDEGLLDEVEVQRRAMEGVHQFGEDRHVGVLAVCQEVELNPSQQTIVGLLASHSHVARVIGVHTREWPESCAARVLGDWDRSESSGIPDNDAPVRLLSSSTRREEIFSVLADVIESGQPFDDVEIAFTDQSLYETGIRAACDRFKIPRASHTWEDSPERRVTHLLRQYCRWIASGYQTELLSHLVRSGLIDVTDLEVDVFELATILDSFPLAVGKIGSGDVRAALRVKAKSRRFSQQAIEALIAFLTAMEEYVPARRIRPSAFISLFRDLAKDRFQRGVDEESTGELDRKLLNRYEDRSLSEVSAPWLAAHIVASIDSDTTTGVKHSHGLRFVPVEHGGYGPRSRLYVLGLDDQAARGAATVVSDHIVGLEEVGLEELENASFATPISTRKWIGELYSRFGLGLTLSAAAYDVQGGRPLFPGSALLELTGIDRIQPEERTTYLDGSDRYQRTRDPEMLLHYSGLRRGFEATNARKSASWTHYDGRVVPKEASVNLRCSPSRLEVLARCPFRYFLSEVLGVPVRQNPEGDWIDKGEEGNLLHSLFERHTRLRIRGEVGLGPEDEQNLLDLLKTHLEEQALFSTSVPALLVQQKTLELSSAVVQYFRRERELSGERQPIAAEYAFGDHEGADAQPMVFDLEQGRIEMTGRIDRIDERSDGRLVIVDYKSGSYKGYAAKDLLKLTDKLQWALYSHAASEKLDRPVESAEYFFTSRKGAGMVMGAQVPARVEVEGVLGTLIARMEKGAFVQAAEKEGACTWCDFKDVCGERTGRREELSRKFRAPDDDLSTPFEAWPYRQRIGSAS